MQQKIPCRHDYENKSIASVKAGQRLLVEFHGKDHGWNCVSDRYQVVEVGCLYRLFQETSAMACYSKVLVGGEIGAGGKARKGAEGEGGRKGRMVNLRQDGFQQSVWVQESLFLPFTPTRCPWPSPAPSPAMRRQQAASHARACDSILRTSLLCGAREQMAGWRAAWS
eukprot:766544-Hanusia_phi.AAC.3